MLKTNSKKARENVQQYIINHFDASNYTDGVNVNTSDFKAVAAFIWNCFKDEKFYADSYEVKHGISAQAAFEDWAQGLPSVIDTCYYYNRSAVDDLATILEETDSEKNKYSEEAAAHYLSYLIFSEIKKAVA